MTVIAPLDAATFFDGHPFALSVFREVRSMLEEIGEVEVRVARTQVAFRHGRGFAYLWMPGSWLDHPTAEVVLSLALDRCVESPRFKEVVQPTAQLWMHHLEIHTLDDLDDEVGRWLARAWAFAGRRARHA